MARARIRAYLIEWAQHKVIQYRERREQDYSEFFVSKDGEVEKHESLESNFSQKRCSVKRTLRSCFSREILVPGYTIRIRIAKSYPEQKNKRGKK